MLNISFITGIATNLYRWAVSVKSGTTIWWYSPKIIGNSSPGWAYESFNYPYVYFAHVRLCKEDSLFYKTLNMSLSYISFLLPQA